MKKVLFGMLSMLLMAIITITMILGVSMAYLIQREIFWMDDQQIRIIFEQEEIYYKQIKDIDEQLGVALRYQLNDDYVDPSSEEFSLLQVAGSLVKLAMSDNWYLADQYASQLHLKYRIYHAQGRPLGGTLPVEKVGEASSHAVYYYDEKTELSAKYKVYILLDDDAEVLQAEVPVAILENYEVQYFCIKYRYAILVGFIVGVILSVGLLLFLCSTIKRKEDAPKELMDHLPLDVIMTMGVVASYFLCKEMFRDINISRQELLLMAPIWFLFLFLALLLIYYFIWRTSRKTWYEDTLITWLIPVAKMFINAWCKVFQNISMAWKFLMLECFLTCLECIVIYAIAPHEQSTLWMMLALMGVKVLLMPWIVLYGVGLGKIQKATHEVASGNMDVQIDVKKLPFPMRGLGEDINSMAQGISVAVEERLKSERLKTELITNVSHDIKTPLTSIINFSDLIKNEKTENEKITEYAEHLHKQSSRLKKLIEDLMEASKASTGNLEIHMEPCDVKVMLGQCVGEFEPRLRENKLELMVKQGEEELQIMADNRMLWRVFENLMHNICKYAQTDTRVYLSAKRVEDQVEIVFKNVSKYPLEIPPEELMERFVRGDLSRHTEGSGLGLSIVSSLMELQGGKLSLMTDGDLFKAILTFPTIKTGEA